MGANRSILLTMLNIWDLFLQVIGQARDPHSHTDAGSDPESEAVVTFRGNSTNETTSELDVKYTMSILSKISWIFHDMINGVAPIVTVIYFAFLYPLAVKQDPAFAASALDINIHGINTIIMIIDNFMNAMPVRVMHAIYPVIYGLVYVVFSLVYYAADPSVHILYPKLLDWSSPGTTIPCIIIVVFVLMPLMQLMWYGLYILRLKLFKRVYGYEYCTTSQE